jgi:hypothetical protein
LGKGMTMLTINDFNKKAKKLFRPELEKYGYEFEEVKIIKIDGIKWSSHPRKF